jgi:ketosteroid isomerase-like protein
MAGTENVELVRRCYDALLRGDVAAILERLDESVEWEVVGPEVIPFAGKFLGRDGVERFFGIVAETVERDGPEAVEVHHVAAIGDRVFALGTDRIRLKPHGVELSCWWVHVFTIEGGRIVKLLELFDREAALRALSRLAPGDAPEVILATLAGEPTNPAEGSPR